jgi:hypothetical protein
MNDDLKIGIECVSMPLLASIETNADIFWIHIGDNVNPDELVRFISNFNYSTNLRVVMTSGHMSEAIHDKFDDMLESRLDQDRLILTVWSNDNFSESLWEFVNVYGSQSSVKLAKALIIDNSISGQMKRLSELASTFLDE